MGNMIFTKTFECQRKFLNEGTCQPRKKWLVVDLEMRFPSVCEHVCMPFSLLTVLISFQKKDDKIPPL